LTSEFALNASQSYYYFQGIGLALHYV